MGLALGSNDYMYISDNTNNKIRKHRIPTRTQTGTDPDLNWASIHGYPHRFTWYRNTLYVSTEME